ncbi:DUF998 domain-containing protein [Corynebacterium sp. 335C]
MPGSAAPAGRAGGGVDRGAWVRAVLALLFAAAYSAWVLEAVLDDGVSTVWGFVSELAARSERHGAFFAGADRLAGVLAVALAVAWAVRRPPARIAAAGLGVWGAATVVDSVARMPVVEVTPMRLGLRPGPAADAATALAGAHGGLFGAAAGDVHAVTSSVAQVGLVVTLVGLMIAVPGLRRGDGRVLAWAALAMAAMTIVTSSLYELAGFNLMLGLWQRAGLLLAVAVVAAAGVADLRARRVAPAAGATAGATDG